MSKENLVDETGLRSLDPKHAAVPLPPGSFDMEKLLPAIDKAHAAKDRDTAISEAIAKGAAEGTVLDRPDPTAQDGFKLVEVERVDLGITETQRVFDPAEVTGDAGGVVLDDPKAATRRAPRKAARRKPSKPTPTPTPPAGDSGQPQE